MTCSSLESLDINMNTQFVLDKLFISIEALKSAVKVFSIEFHQYFFNNFFRLTLSLYKCKNMVDIVGNNIVLVNKGKFLSCFLFGFILPPYNSWFFSFYDFVLILRHNL